MPVDSRLLCMMHVSFLDKKACSQGMEEACTNKMSSTALKVSGKTLSNSCYASSMYTQADVQLNLHSNGQQDPTERFPEKEVLSCNGEVHSELYKDHEYALPPLGPPSQFQ
jgi:hypothetical protein